MATTFKMPSLAADQVVSVWYNPDSTDGHHIALKTTDSSLVGQFTQSRFLDLYLLTSPLASKVDWAQREFFSDIKKFDPTPSARTKIFSITKDHQTSYKINSTGKAFEIDRSVDLKEAKVLIKTAAENLQRALKINDQGEFVGDKSEFDHALLICHTLLSSLESLKTAPGVDPAAITALQKEYSIETLITRVCSRWNVEAGDEHDVVAQKFNALHDFLRTGPGQLVSLSTQGRLLKSAFDFAKELPTLVDPELSATLARNLESAGKVYFKEPRAAAPVVVAPAAPVVGAPTAPATMEDADFYHEIITFLIREIPNPRDATDADLKLPQAMHDAAAGNPQRLKFLEEALKARHDRIYHGTEFPHNLIEGLKAVTRGLHRGGQWALDALRHLASGPRTAVAIAASCAQRPSGDWLARTDHTLLDPRDPLLRAGAEYKGENLEEILVRVKSLKERIQRSKEHHDTLYYERSSMSGGAPLGSCLAHAQRDANIFDSMDWMREGLQILNIDFLADLQEIEKYSRNYPYDEASDKWYRASTHNRKLHEGLKEIEKCLDEKLAPFYEKLARELDTHPELIDDALEFLDTFPQILSFIPGRAPSRSDLTHLTRTNAARDAIKEKVDEIREEALRELDELAALTGEDPHPLRFELIAHIESLNRRLIGLGYPHHPLIRKHQEALQAAKDALTTLPRDPASRADHFSSIAKTLHAIDESWIWIDGDSVSDRSLLDGHLEFERNYTTQYPGTAAQTLIESEAATRSELERLRPQKVAFDLYTERSASWALRDIWHTRNTDAAPLRAARERYAQLEAKLAQIANAKEAHEAYELTRVYLTEQATLAQQLIDDARRLTTGSTARVRF